jgi:hypothetical protein
MVSPNIPYTIALSCRTLCLRVSVVNCRWFIPDPAISPSPRQEQGPFPSNPSFVTLVFFVTFVVNRSNA